MCYHGCSRECAEKVLSNRGGLQASRNKWDWLGRGVYFWVDSWARGIDWALHGKKIDDPYVIGAYVYPGLCLNLTDYAVADQIKQAFAVMNLVAQQTGGKLPRNNNFFRRDLDCAVIEYLHAFRDDLGLDPYDTVLGAFEEGDPVFDGSLFKQKTHLQIVVREGHEDCIIGYFRVPGIEHEIIKAVKDLAGEDIGAK